MTLVILLCIASFLVGALPFGLWIGLAWKGVDIRTLGSRNIGATNVLRVLGPGPGIAVFVLDTLKGAAVPAITLTLWPALAAWHPGMDVLAMPFRILIGLCAILGHTFSPFLRFKGGKGVATSLGVLLALSPWVALVAFIAWGLVLGIARYVSLASLVAAFTLPFTAILVLTGNDRWWMLGLGAVLAILVTVRHAGNIRRLLDHTEPKIGQRVTPDAEATADPAEVR